jgi:hypothetical protein
MSDKWVRKGAWWHKEAGGFTWGLTQSKVSRQWSLYRSRTSLKLRGGEVLQYWSSPIPVKRVDERWVILKRGDSRRWSASRAKKWAAERMLTPGGQANKKPTFVVRSPAQGLKVINHPDIAANFARALKRTPKHKVAVLVPCAATKPFPDAPSHKSGYLDALAGKKVDKHVVSEPLGVVPYEWSRTYPNDSYDFPPEYLKGAPFDALAKRIGQWFDVVGKKYDRIYLALPAHHSRLVKAALKGKPTKHITWVGQRQCLDQNVCADGEYRATTHSYRGFLKKNVRGAANRARPAGAVAPPEGLWRLDACHGYYLRWYAPGSRLTGRLKYRRFKEVHKTSSLRAWWLREFATVANELQLRPEGISPRVLRRVARGGWLRTPVGAPDEVRLAALRDAYRDHFAGGRGTRAPNPGFRTVQAALGSDWPDDAVWLVHNTAVAVAAEARRPWADYAVLLGRAGERIEDELMRYTPSGDVEVSWRSRWQDGGLGHEIEQALEAYNETA